MSDDYKWWFGKDLVECDLLKPFACSIWSSCVWFYQPSFLGIFKFQRLCKWQDHEEQRVKVLSQTFPVRNKPQTVGQNSQFLTKCDISWIQRANYLTTIFGSRCFLVSGKSLLWPCIHSHASDLCSFYCSQINKKIGSSGNASYLYF